MKGRILFMMAFFTLGLQSCYKEVTTLETITGAGDIVTESRTHSNFSGVSASGSFDVHISQGKAFAVVVKAYENLLPYLESKVEHGVLKLGYRTNTLINNDNAEVFITMPELSVLRLSGSGNIIATGNFPATDMFDVALTGSGDIYIAQGTAQVFKSSLSGSGNIHAFGVVGKRAETTTFGSGNTEVTATERLFAKISGSGNVYYKNSPVVTKEISGSGNVLPR